MKTFTSVFKKNNEKKPIVMDFARPEEEEKSFLFLNDLLYTKNNDFSN